MKNTFSFLPFRAQSRSLSKQTLLLVSFFVFSFGILAQEKTKDSVKIENLNEVLIKAIRVSADSPITHSNVSKEDLEKRNLGQDIPILLNYLPSVVTTSDAGAGIGYTGIRVRGVDSRSTNITINGIPYNDAESLATFWVNLGDFSSSIESLQLQRGVGTSTNGSGAFGASVNILTDDISDKANAEISNSFGSFNSRKHNLKFSTGLLSDNERSRSSSAERSRSIEIAGRLSKIKSDGYIDRAETDLDSYFLQASYIDDNTLIKTLVFGGHEITYQAWNGINAETLATNRTFNPSGIYTDDSGNTQFYDNEEDNYKQDHYQLHWSEKLNANWFTNLGLNYTYGRGFFEQYKEDEALVNYDLENFTSNGQTISTTDLIRRRWLDNGFYVLNANANFKKNEINLFFGASISHYDGGHFGEVIWTKFANNSQVNNRYYDGNGLKNDFNVFTKATYKLNEKISLFADLQLRFVNYKTSGITSDRVALNVNENFNFFNPKAGINYKLNITNSFYFSYARANREPNRDDFKNNINVQPEQLNDFELGWRYNTNSVSLNTNLYYMLYNEQLVLTGNLDDVGDPIRTNSGDSYRLGLEIDAKIKINDKLALQPNVAFSTNKNNDFVTSLNGELVSLGKTDISFSPEIIASNAVIFNPIPNLQLSLLSKYVGEQFMGNTENELSKLSSYFVNDFNLVYKLSFSKNEESDIKVPFIKSITFNALVNNIFNKKYVSNGYFGSFNFDDASSSTGITTGYFTGYYPQATTNFLVGATLKF